jgi:tetratricopeptide (TPR) repeat protein
MVEPISTTATLLLETASTSIVQPVVKDHVKCHRVSVAVAMLWLIGMLGSGGILSPCPAQSVSPEDTQKWATRLTESSRELLGDKRVDKNTRRFFRSMASYTLALAGQTEEAIALARECHDDEERLSLISGVADAQSTNDDVVGAFQTADSLPEGYKKQWTLSLIAIRQAQIGDFDEAVALLDRISDTRQRNRAVGTIVAAMLKAQAYQQAADLCDQTEDDETREQLRESMKSHRTEPMPGDPDFTQRTVEHFKQAWSYAGLSEEDIQFVRLKCRARIAIHHKDQAAVGLAMDEALRTVAEWEIAKRRAALLSIGMIYHEAGDAAAACETFRKVLDGFLIKSDGEDEPWIDIVRMSLATGTDLESIVDVMSDDEIQLWAAKMVDVPDAADLLGGFAGAMVARGKRALVEKLYELLETPEQRFYVASRALEVYSRLRRSADGAGEPDAVRKRGHH